MSNGPKLFNADDEGDNIDVAAFLAGDTVDQNVPEGHRSGIIAIVGRPNVGKSTLLNAMVGQKVAIVTEVPGTTRNAIRAVVTRDDAQLVFIDTPGLSKPRTLLAQRLNELVHETWQGVDLILFLVDGDGGIGTGDRFLAQMLARVSTPKVCVITKEDRLTDKWKMVPILDEASKLLDALEIVPTSAASGMNVDVLIDVLVKHLPEGPRLFPTGMVSDQPTHQLAAELIREKFINRMGDELPHSIMVVVSAIEESEDREGMLVVTATIYVERDSQKGIVIGKGGIVLQEAGKEAREELEVVLGAKVHLDVKVKIAKDWQKDPKRLARFGY